jgi:hypothetical protein
MGEGEMGIFSWMGLIGFCIFVAGYRGYMTELPGFALLKTKTV